MKDRVDIFLEQYRTRIPEYLTDLEMVARQNNIPVMAHSTGDLLRYALGSVGAKNVLEIGTAVGYSALYMKECLPEDAHITTIEKIDARYEQAETNFAAYDKKKQITLLKEDAADAIEWLKKEGQVFDLIFLDAAKGQYVSYLPTLVELLRSQGVLVTDNVFHNGTVMNSRYAVTQRDRTIHERLREYLKAITEHPELNTLILPMDDGVAVCKKK